MPPGDERQRDASPRDLTQHSASAAGPARRRSSGRPKGADSAARRDEILETAARLFSEEGYRGTSMSAVARACGLSQTGLLHYFPGKDQLLAAVMEWRDARDLKQLRSLAENEPRGWAAIEQLVDLVRLNVQQPGIVRLFTTLAGEATQQDHPASSWLVAHHAMARQNFLRQFQEAAEDGELDPQAPVESMARILLASMDGLQIQWLTDPDYSGEAMARDFEELVRGFRERWGR